MVTELIINAMKYAYPDGKGPIRVILRSGEGQRAVLAVEDDGIGRPETPGGGKDGLGRMIVKAMATKLNAEWGQDAAHSGMRVTFSFDRTAAATAH